MFLPQAYEVCQYERRVILRLKRRFEEKMGRAFDTHLSLILDTIATAIEAKMQLEIFLTHFQGVKKNGSGYKALCPGHDDKEQSLKIDQGDDRKLLIKCFAGCHYKVILQAVGLLDTDLFNDPPRNNGNAKQKTIIAEYPYTDETRETIYQTVRYDPKEFKQRRPDGNGGWIWNLEGVRRVLFQLPDVIKSQTVFVPEGEKDCLGLRSLGLVATTNVCGASAKWLPEYSEGLRGKHVVIFPDNDDPGRKHAQDIAHSLEGIASSVKIVNLPDLPAKGDVSDWLEAKDALETESILKELQAIVETAPEWQPEADRPEDKESGGAVIVSEDFHQTDTGNASRMVSLWGDSIRYVPAWGVWLTWDDIRWSRDLTGEIVRKGKETIRKMYARAAGIEETNQRKTEIQHALKSESEARIMAMIELAKPELPAVPGNLNTDPWLLNCLNGTVDLRTGELHPHSRKNMITKLAPVAYDPDAKAPGWFAFLARIMNDNEKKMRFLQRAVGYSMTGDTTEHCFFLLCGSGANGKSTFLQLIQSMLGDYSQQAAFDTFLIRDHGGIPNDLARLEGAHFVASVEADMGRRLAEGVVKQLTGGDKITARFLHREFFEFTPTFKLWLACNHKPIIRGNEDAMWRRIRLIPFTVQIPETDRDPKMAERLKAELPGILAWAVKGCLEWQRIGLQPPEEVLEATARYRSDSDVMGQFIDECCTIERDATVPAGDLHDAYKTWSGEKKPINKQVFGTLLGERGFISDRGAKGKRLWLGIRFKDATER